MNKMPISLSEQEQIVLKGVQEYLNKNRLFNMEKVLHFLHSRFKLTSINISNRGIEVILKSLVKKSLVAEGSKLTREDLLLNHKRNRIYEFILKNPGAYYNKMIKELKISRHVLIWHLNMLMEFNFIKKETIENRKIYFDSNMEFEDVKKIYYTSKTRNKRILNYLKKNNAGVTKTQLSTDLKIHTNTIRKYLNSLEEFKLIIKKNLSNKELYFLKEE